METLLGRKEEDKVREDCTIYCKGYLSTVGPYCSEPSYSFYVNLMAIHHIFR